MNDEISRIAVAVSVFVRAVCMLDIKLFFYSSLIRTGH